jgi:hypothetical protein
VNVGDVSSSGPKAQEMALVIEAQSLAERDVPDTSLRTATSKVSFNRVPTLDEGALSGPYGTEPGHRVLLALIFDQSNNRGDPSGSPFWFAVARRAP